MEKAKIFLLGMATAVGIAFLLGASPGSESGRYQAGAWGGPQGYGVFVVDTRTGEARWVHTSRGIDQMGKPFVEVKSGP